MSNDDILTDDYVAGLLDKDAGDFALRYSAMGMEALESDKKPANKPKPNKRFLRHIIKDTDHHNKTLLAKEAAESQARLKNLERAEEVKRRKTNPNTRDIRRRQMGDIHAILGGKRRVKDEGESSNGRESSKRESKSHDREPRSRQDKDLFRDRHSHRRQHGRLDREDDDRISGDSPRRDDKHRRRRAAEDESEEDGKHRHSRRRRDRSSSPRRRRSHSPRERRRKHRHRSPLDKEASSPKRSDKTKEEDSDPLDDLIGPAPPPRRRGRGAIGGEAGLDRRFSESYDPRTDVQMDDDDNEAGKGDWDDAMEAFRDRQKLKQHQEKRLREAGFATEQIERAAISGTERTEDDVRWKSAGEGREWDLGKAELDGGLSNP